MRQLFTLTGDPWYLDIAPDGSIYADQISQNNMILRSPPSGGVPERLGGTQEAELALVLPDGRPLVYTVSGFRRRFQIVQRDGVLSPLIEGSEEYGMPAALAGDREVAVLSDRKPDSGNLSDVLDGWSGRTGCRRDRFSRRMGLPNRYDRSTWGKVQPDTCQFRWRGAHTDLDARRQSRSNGLDDGF
jgi:hypothetical protein